MSLNKGIAIRTILLLLVGVIVAGVLIYLVYSVTTGSTLSSTACQSRVISYCTRRKMMGWNDGACSCDDGTCLGSGCCPPVGTDPNCPWNQWVKNCVKSDTDWHWNFDPSATASNYDQTPSQYCPRVGVK